MLYFRHCIINTRTGSRMMVWSALKHLKSTLRKGGGAVMKTSESVKLPFCVGVFLIEFRPRVYLNLLKDLWKALDFPGRHSVPTSIVPSKLKAFNGNLSGYHNNSVLFMR